MESVTELVGVTYRASILICFVSPPTQAFTAACLDDILTTGLCVLLARVTELLTELWAR